MQPFIKQNAWGIFLAVIAVTISWATMSSKVNAVSNDYSKIEQRLNKIDDAILRITILEEHDKNISSDIDEIKRDVKDLKAYFQIKP